jgi:hypothetical protein
MIPLTARTKRFLGAFAACTTVLACSAFIGYMTVQSAAADQENPGAPLSSDASPIYGVTIPPGYRDWKLISMNHLVTDKVKQVRAQLGNDIAIKAFKEGTRPFPDGSIIAALHWQEVSSQESDQLVGSIFPGAHSGFAGPPANVQFMVKDSKKYAATGGWGFGDFKNGKPSDRSVHEACFSCHTPAKDRDYVFAHYALAP